MARYRIVNKNLQAWSDKSKRKPLIVRGARQVGKTTVIHDFGRSFKQYLYFNLENIEQRALFEDADSIQKLVKAIFFYHGKDEKKDSETLLFIDEIQGSPKAIQFLRYFYEEYPSIRVIAAGSLLEFALSRIKSFPVGRVEYMVMHPMNFVEFLHAIGRSDAAELMQIYPIADHAHELLKDLFHEYALIGGMPEVVDTYADTMSVSTLNPIYDSILQGYFDDVEKYASSTIQIPLLRYIIRNAPAMLHERITFQNFNRTNYKSREVGEAFRVLEDALLVKLVYPNTETSFPSTPDMRKRPRLQFIDTGLGVHRSNLFLEAVNLKDLHNLSKGFIVEHIVAQELLSSHDSVLYANRFWTREKQGSAECDLIYQYGTKMIPIEIKAGKTGRLRSLFTFIDKCDHHYAVRVHGHRFMVEQIKTINGKPFYLMNIPYYLGTQIPMYIEHFVNNY